MSEFARSRRLFFTLAFFAACLLAMPRLQAAELRTWTAASGGFTIEAELVAIKPGDVAQLKTKDGRTIEVPLAQLSAADQQYARKPAAAPAASTSGATTATSVSAKFNDVQRQADRCRTPGEALVLFKVFHDDAATSAADKVLAAARIEDYKRLVAEKKVRLNKQWVSGEEAAAVRKKADELMRQGLELLKLDQEETCKKKFAEAAALETDEIRADFILGFIYFMNREIDKALPIFQRCLLRDPENIAVLNNIALLSAAKGDWIAMAGHWRKALAKQPDQRLVHNVGRFLSQAVFTNVAVPKSARESLALPYTELVASGKYKATDPQLGWLILLIEESALDFSFKDDDEEKKAAQKKPAVPDANEDGIVNGGGTGFVVHPGYVLTNAHVAEDDAVFEIQTQDGKRLRGTRVAKAPDADLALIKCEELTAPPLVFAKDVSPRGTDVMVFGFPEMFLLGASLKATRGSISSIPDPQTEPNYLYDAVTNSGNSGSPVCDAAGNVIAVHFSAMNTAVRYGRGVPAAKAREFLNQALSNAIHETQPSTARLDWPQVDAKVSPSTVLIWVRSKTAAATGPQVGGDLLELPICLFCGGQKQMRCTTPNCARNRAAGRGRSCIQCRGTGLADCQVCDGLGVDIQLASIQDAVKRARAAKAAASRGEPVGNNTPGTGSAPAGGSVAKGPAAQGDSEISLAMLQGLRMKARPGDPNSLSEGKVEAGLGFDPGLLEQPAQTLTEQEIKDIISTLEQNPLNPVYDAAKRLVSSKPSATYRNDVAAALEARLEGQQSYWQVKSHVCRALGYWGRDESKPKIHALLRADSWVVRRQASITIAHSKDAGGVPALVECLIRPADVNDSSGKVNPKFERGLFLRALIVLGPQAIPELQRVRPQQNTKVQEMIDFIIVACRG